MWRKRNASLRKHPFLLALRSWGRFVRVLRGSSARNVPSGEERGETDVFAGLGITAVPREIENNAHAKFWGQIRFRKGNVEVMSS